MLFEVPLDYPLSDKITKIIEGKKYIQVQGIRWFTNLKVSKSIGFIPLTKHYNSQDYPKYDNYDAIEVSKIKDIPLDYYETMGVPITFLDKWNPDQFQILGIAKRRCPVTRPSSLKSIPVLTPRIITTSILPQLSGSTGKLIIKYPRILIRTSTK